MHGERIYRAQLPDSIVEHLVREHLVNDLSQHIWDGGTCADPGWVYLDHVALNHLVKEGLVVAHVSMFLNIDPTKNLWFILNPMEPLPA